MPTSAAPFARFPADDQWIPLTTAAHRMGVTHQRALAMVCTGEVSGERLAGRWVVAAADVERLAAERAARVTA